MHPIFLDIRIPKWVELLTMGRSSKKTGSLLGKLVDLARLTRMCLAASDVHSLQVLGCFVGDNLQVDRCWLVRMFDLDRHCSEMIALAANCKCVWCVGPERFLTRFNKIAIQGTPQMAAGKESVSLSKVHSCYSNRPYSRRGHDGQKERLGLQIYCKFARQYVNCDVTSLLFHVPMT